MSGENNGFEEFVRGGFVVELSAGKASASPGGASTETDLA